MATSGFIASKNKIFRLMGDGVTDFIDRPEFKGASLALCIRDLNLLSQPDDVSLTSEGRLQFASVLLASEEVLVFLE